MTHKPPPPEAVVELLALLDEAGLSAERHAVLKDLLEQYLQVVALIGKPGVTMTEIRARLRIQIG